MLTLAEMGLQGLVALFALLAAAARMLKRARRAAVDAESRALAVGASVAFACMMLGNVYGSPFIEGTVMGAFWALLGLVERYVLLRHAASVRSPVPSTAPGRAAPVPT